MSRTLLHDHSKVERWGRRAPASRRSASPIASDILRSVRARTCGGLDVEGEAALCASCVRSGVCARLAPTVSSAASLRSGVLCALSCCARSFGPARTAAVPVTAVPVRVTGDCGGSRPAVPSLKPGSETLGSLAMVAACDSHVSARGCTATHSTQHTAKHTARHIAHAHPSKAQTDSTTQKPQYTTHSTQREHSTQRHAEHIAQHAQRTPYNTAHNATHSAKHAAQHNTQHRQRSAAQQAQHTAPLPVHSTQQHTAPRTAHSTSPST